MSRSAARHTDRAPSLDLVTCDRTPSSADTPARAVHADRLWLALHLPQLALHALGATDRDDHERVAQAVSVRHGRRALVLTADARARRAGVNAGMSVAAACCICPELNVHAHDETLERAALEGLAMWSGRYTSVSVLAPPRGLLLEVGSSLRLFEGLGPLLVRVREDLQALGHTPMLGIAPTARAAWLLARAGDTRPITLPRQLADRLASVPVDCLELAAKTLDDLSVLGIRTVGDCMRLPRDGLGRRFGRELLMQLDEALGLSTDARAPWIAPSRFERRVELAWGSRDHAMLEQALARMLQELEGFLIRRAMGACALEIHIGHHARAATRFTLELMSPVRDAGYLRTLLSQRLERVSLPADAVYVGLRVSVMRPLAPMMGDLFGTSSCAVSDRRDAPQLLVERLMARLGRDRVQMLVYRPDPRPERTTRPAPWGTQDHRTDLEIVCDPIAAGLPLWLLREPRRLHDDGERPRLQQTLDLEQGPQRIEGGWWDGADVARDYYVARDADGARYWVYRDRRAPRHWYLHGVFA